jgi:hypothetical protein
MSQQLQQLEILDHLRPYLKAIYNVSGNITEQVDLFNDQYKTARFMLNKCYNAALSDDDIAPNFMVALKKFAENVRLYDMPLKADSPIGVLVHRNKSKSYFDSTLIDDGEGLILQAIKKLLNKNTSNDVFEYSYNRSNNNTGNQIVYLRPKYFEEILNNLQQLIKKSEIIVNRFDCTEFIAKINALKIDNFQEDDLKLIVNIMFPINLETDLSREQYENKLLLNKVFNVIAKKINEIGGKCFEIPYLTYSTSKETRTLIDKMYKEEIDPVETDIFFTLFSIIQFDGKDEKMISNIQTLKQLDNNNLNNLRINLKKVEKESFISQYLIENWLPLVKPGGKIYYNDKDFLVVSKPYISGTQLLEMYGIHSVYIREFFNNIVSGIPVDINYFLNIFEKTNPKSLDNCLNEYKPGPSTDKESTDTKTTLLNFISGRMEEKPGPKSKYFGTVQFDTNNDNETKVLRASYNGWKLNKSTGKYEKSVNGKLVEYEPSLELEDD